MPSPSPIADEHDDPRSPLADPWAALDERWPDWRRRVGGLALALLLEGGLLLLLLTLGYSTIGSRDAPEALTTVSFDEEPPAPDAPTEPEEAQAPPTALPRAVPTPPPPDRPMPSLPIPVPLPPAAELSPETIPAPTPTTPRVRAVVRNSAAGPAGPPNRAIRGDSERVGTASNGEPLYRARWYREPTDQELRGYLSTATGPGWALINCRTVPDYRVEDCELVDEYPSGSQMGRAVLAAAWQFKVRPPQVGGRVLVGAWVRIRISYELKG